MTQLQILGALMCALPFMVMFFYFAVQDGLKVSLAVFSITALFMAWVTLAASLLVGAIK